MNSLSWFIYLINVIPSIGAIMMIVSIVSAVGIGIISMAHMINRAEQRREEGKRAFDEISAPLYRYWRKVFIWIFGVTLPLGVLIPNQTTIILIGASEFGERMVQSERVQNIVDPSYQLLETWIKRELTKLKDETSKR